MYLYERIGKVLHLLRQQFIFFNASLTCSKNGHIQFCYAKRHRLGVTGLPHLLLSTPPSLSCTILDTIALPKSCDDRNVLLFSEFNDGDNNMNFDFRLRFLN